MTKQLIEYVRNEESQPIGVVIAEKVSDESFNIGWSLCCKKDKFDKKMAFKIALGRLRRGSNVSLPYKVEPYYRRMIERGVKYFKTTGVINSNE